MNASLNKSSELSHLTNEGFNDNEQKVGREDENLNEKEHQESFNRLLDDAIGIIKK